MNKRRVFRDNQRESIKNVNCAQKIPKNIRSEAQTLSHKDDQHTQMKRSSPAFAKAGGWSVMDSVIP